VKVFSKVAVAVAAVAALLVLAAVLAAGSGEAKPKQTVRVAVVADTGSLNDKGFNTLAVQGLEKAEKELGIEGRVYPSGTAADRTPNLQAAAQAGYGLVIANGVLFTFGPLPTVAPANPNTKFLGIDVNFPDLEGKPANVRGVQFREQGGRLSRRQHRGARGEASREAVHFRSRRQQGDGDRPLLRRLQLLREASVVEGQGPQQLRGRPDLQRPDEVQDDGAQPDRARIADRLRRRRRLRPGRDGRLRSRRGVWAIGVDADQYFLGPFVLTSATKKVNVAVYNAIKEYAADPAGFKTGTTRTTPSRTVESVTAVSASKLPKPVAKAYTASTNALAEADRERQGQGSLRGIEPFASRKGRGAMPRPFFVCAAGVEATRPAH
jgi:basic membrane protein A